MGGGQKGKRGAEPPIQKGSGSIAKKKPEAKAADSAAKPRKQKAAKGRELPDDEALIAWLISCAAGSEKPVKRTLDKQEDLDMELVAALAAEACHTSRHGGCDRYRMRPLCRLPCCVPPRWGPPGGCREGSDRHALAQQELTVPVFGAGLQRDAGGATARELPG